MVRFVRVALAVLALTIAPLRPLAAAEPVDLLLVLAADVSRSVDARKFQLQREGYAAALADPRVLDAIKSGPNRRIAICLVEWSGTASQKVVIDWTLIDGAPAAQRFGDRQLEMQRSFADRTSISGGIEFALSRFTNAPFEAKRRTIDVSGDGTNNSGRDVRSARDEALGHGVTINGLVILSEHPLPWNPEHTNPPGGLAQYYRDNVIGGPGAFVMEAKDFNSFGQALIGKLIAEIAAERPESQTARLVMPIYHPDLSTAAKP
jgi:hypothetical protein